MKKSLRIIALLFVAVLAFNGAAFGWGTNGGDGGRFSQLQEIGVFFNNSGSTLSAGDVVILDISGSGNTAITSGTNLGSYVRLTSDGIPDAALADHVLAIGVVKSSSADQTPVGVVTRGPVDTTCDDSSDAVTIRTAVGTSAATSGRCGGGTNLGVALEAGDGTDGDTLFIWVQGIGTE